MRMRDRHRSVVCVVLWFSVAIGPGDRLTNAEERVTPAMAADIDEFAARILATDTVPGMGVAVVTSQGIAYATGYGFADVESRRPATADTQFYIASTTKALTALAAALLHDREQLDLDAPLSQYLPDVQMHPELSAEDVALRDLLTMTHGIEPIGPVDIRTAFTGDFTYPGLQALLRHHPPAQSGRDFRYSNLGYNVFSIVLEDRFGGGWKQVVRDAVLLPLRMDSTTAFVTRADPGPGSAGHAVRLPRKRARTSPVRQARRNHAGGRWSHQYRQRHGPLRGGATRRRTSWRPAGLPVPGD